MFVQFFLSLLIAVLTTENAQSQVVTRAICSIENGTIQGHINLTSFDQKNYVIVEAEVEGLANGFHGFTVHEYGDLSNGCEATGAHYNPFGNRHGFPEYEDRHVGDLGNIVAGRNGFGYTHIRDSQIKLSGPYSILGRAIVIHKFYDNYGRYKTEEGLKTGNSGPGVACCVIAVVPNT